MKKTILTLFIVLLVVVVHAQITFTATFSPSNLSLDTIKAADSNIYTKVKLANYSVCSGKQIKTGKLVIVR